MPSVRQSIATFSPTNSVGEFVQGVGEKSVRRAIWRYKLAKVNDLFEGATSEAEEDEALAIILSAESADEIIFLVNNLTWDGLDDDLDEPDLDRILHLLAKMVERRDYPVIGILRQVFSGDPDTLPGISINQLSATAASMGGLLRQPLANELVGKRDPLLDQMAIIALRGRRTLFRELKTVMDFLQTVVANPNPLQQLNWELFYTDFICTQLERGEVRALMQRLSDMLNVTLPGGAVQRTAWFDMLRRWDREFMALDGLIKAVGNASQKTDMRNFLDMRRFFMDSFPGPAAAPGQIAAAIQSVLTAINGVAGNFQDLVAAVQQVVDTIADFSVPNLLGSSSDDIAVDATNILAGQNLLQMLPTGYKSTLINLMLDGAVEDEEEQAILAILRMSKSRSVADFAQIAAQATWEKLYNSFDGQEYDDLEGLFTF